MKINFNYKSAKAWVTLLGSILAGVLGVLTALGVTVPANLSSTITGLITALVSLLSALGILTQDVDDPNKKGD